MRNKFKFKKRCENCPAHNIYDCMKRNQAKYNKTKKGQKVIKTTKTIRAITHPDYHKKYSKQKRDTARKNNVCIACFKHKTYKTKLCYSCKKAARRKTK